MFRRSKYARLTAADPRQLEPVRIVGDGLVFDRDLMGGKGCPLLIIDTSRRPDIEKLIELHDYIPEGDLELQWVQLDGRESFWTLRLDIRNPLDCLCLIDFDIATQGILVESVMHAQAFFLQAGRDGDRPMTTQNARKIFVQMINLGACGVWERQHLKALSKRYRALGLSRKAAKEKAVAALVYMREVVRYRFSNPG